MGLGEGNSAAPDFGDIRCQETVAWVASSAVSRLSKSLASSARKVGLDHHPYLGPLGRRDGAFGNLRCDRGHRGRDVGRIRDRRQIEIHGAPRRGAMIRSTQSRIATASPHDFPRQRLHISVEQRLGDLRRLVPAPGSPARSVARLAPDKVAFGRLLDLLLQEII
jgi:hypothetical protein